jgi:hypothetical protein
MRQMTHQKSVGSTEIILFFKPGISVRYPQAKNATSIRKIH